MRRILIVDDEPSIQALLTDLLSDEGYLIDQAADGQTAVELAQATQPDLILMDLSMPVKSGVAAIHQLKADPATRSIRVIAMSAGVNLQQCIRHLPADGLLPKPFDVEILLASVEALLREPRTSV